MLIKVSDLMRMSGVEFGTSGVRGLVSEMTDRVCYAYTLGFLQYLRSINQIEDGTHIGLAGDYRESTNKILRAVACAVSDMGYVPINCGQIPTPALTLYGLKRSIPTVMVTGSHIPDDRNGIKFNKSDGEILKRDELEIKRQSVDVPDEIFNENGSFINEVRLPGLNNEARDEYLSRYIEFFPKNCLNGIKLGLYEHSSVAREVLNDILTALGADVTSLGYSTKFISVDTEAIREEDISLALKWAKEHTFDSIISTDGDGDRPLISDEYGTWLRGDVAGILCAQSLNADCVVTPVSSNTAVEKSRLFKSVNRTRIGSPYVIEAMKQAKASCNTVVGYEANGGFLMMGDIERNGKILRSLPTRDAAIVPICIILLAKKNNSSISQLLELLPKRYTSSDRLKNFPSELSKTILSKLTLGDIDKTRKKVNDIFGQLAGEVRMVDSTDGVRMTFNNDEIIHLRPSGNAPELRCYTEADSQTRASELNSKCMSIMAQWPDNES